MATPWNNMGIYSSNVDHDDKIVVGPYDDSRYTASSGFSYARQPSTQPANSTSQLISPPLLSPPVARVSPGPSSPRSRSPASPRSFQSLNSPSSAGFPLSPFYPPSQENQFLNSPVSDGFYSQRTSGATDPRFPTKAPNMMEMVLETPYFDTPPHTPGDTSFRSTDVLEPTEVPLNNGWRPWWLRRRVVSIFMGVCIMLGIIGEVVMWWLSQKDVDSNLKGLWTFGPVVVVSIVAILWARVEAQALLYMPWIVLDRKPTTVDETRRKQSHRTILLDYHSLGSFQALNTAFHNRHHLVVAAIAIKFLLRAQIVLSTAIFHAEIHVDGTSLLRARLGVLHAMAGTFLIISMALLPMLYHAPSPRGIAPRDPTSPAGTATLLTSSHQFLTRLSNTGHANMETVAARLAGSWYTTELTQPGRRPEEMFQLRQHGGGSGPLCMNPPNVSPETIATYRPWTQSTRTKIMSIVASVALIAGTCVIFGLKGKGEGLDVDDSIFVVWTCTPTIIFAAIAVFWTRIDIDNRRLAPFLKLTTTKHRFQESLGLSYMNEFGLHTAGKAMKTQDWAVFLAKCTAMLGWLMPIFTAGLFAVSQVAQTANLELRPETKFGSTSKSLSAAVDSDIIDQILMRQTPKYPRWTWEDVALPKLSLVSHPREWPLPNTELVAKVPGLRSKLNCETVSFDQGEGADLQCVPLGGSKKKAICDAGQSRTALVASSCSQLTSSYPIKYVWGSCAGDGLISVMMCNQSLVEVTVDTTFRTEDLYINTNQIPIVNASSEQPSNVKADITSVYAALDDFGADDKKLTGLDGFFRTLVLSRLSTTLERIVMPERQNSVSQAIRQLHGIIAAQAINGELIRRPLVNKLRMRDDSQPIIPAHVDYVIPRLMQSIVQTFVLIGLLVFTLLFGLLSLRTASRGTLPKSPGSIAAQASLLADSSLWWRLPDGAEWMEDDDLARCLRRKTFHLGWSQGASGNQTYGIYIVQDEGKAARPTGASQTTADNSEGSRGVRYISMAPGVYSYNDIKS
ncbi:hypothetical protein FVEN_g5302 [Fusarium venenatum]|uniref:Uncharacterized protein n=1 Tax=Fusarium venenatum TaxID=56646 RepID=A0A2L2TR89_9HYPO|nr:uncharacterized protein FVRRES_08628 [Fusarium venenatum]KAG8356738.1 hypothetical protein FVEN_g5302 [Fusarium venenatum]KAH6965389.1 hypothetical protein EDB82DRAFT_561246 [Fusarium venenatum]CEI68551.1 unnamed protein product [Fusarium venenatum]